MLMNWLKASQEFLTRVPVSTAVEVQQAVAIASQAQPQWAATTMAKRRGKLLQFAILLRQESARIVSVISSDRQLYEQATDPASRSNVFVTKQARHWGTARQSSTGPWTH